MSEPLGELGPTGPTLRFERAYAHPIETVWAAVTDPRHQAVWFPQQILGRREAGAPLRFVTSVDPDDGFDGEMIAYDPPRLIEFSWGASRLRIELTPLGAGTRLVLAELLDDLGGAARNGAGWHECLDRLTALVDGTERHPWGRRWHAVHPAYVDAFGPTADILRAPAGWDRDLPDDPDASRFPRYTDDGPTPLVDWTPPN